MDSTKPVTKKAAPKKAAVSVDKPSIKHTLEFGEKGPAVLWAQQRLAELGFYEKLPDGRYGTVMAKAVRRWQNSRDAKLTGTITLKEWDAL